MSFHDTTSETQDLIKYKSTPLKRSLAISESIKEDLSSSFQISGNSPMVTEDLILNENIEFIISESNSLSTPVSFTYTKTLGSGVSSMFPSFEASNFFLNSVPQSRNESFSGKQAELSAPQAFSIDYLKIPNISASTWKKMKRFAENEEYSEVIVEISQDVKTDNIEDEAEEYHRSESSLIYDKKTCGCELCTII